LRVTAPIVEAQIVETFLLNCLGYQTMIATKATRVATACAGRAFVDFSPRRDHGTDAAMKTARASAVGGAAGTSLVLAGRAYGLELSGTMAHSYVMRFPSETDAFLTFARDFPGRAIFLIDTFDTEEAARSLAAMADRLRVEDLVPQAVRLDSGDLAALSRSVRQILDDGGLRDVRIFASGDLDEYRIAGLLAEEAPIDAFGVGTRVGVSADAPYLDSVYKLVEFNGRPTLKLSEAKATEPGRKQTFRGPEGDMIGLREETAPPRSEPMLVPVMRGGRRTGPRRGLEVARRLFEADLVRLPQEACRLVDPVAPVARLSDALRRLTDEARADALRRAGVPS
jgi:nicotinate phosphoribosyltransferase